MSINNKKTVRNKKSILRSEMRYQFLPCRLMHIYVSILHFGINQHFTIYCHQDLFDLL